jgi:hypothetical protein
MTKISNFTVGVIITAAMLILAMPISRLMHAPVEAFDDTLLYVCICSAGAIFIVAYLIPV